METLTTYNRIVAAMLANKDKEWWYATDFMQPKCNFDSPFYVGYEASARMSQMMHNYPFMFEVAKDGKYRILRFKFEELESIKAKVYQDDMLAVLNTYA